MESIDRPSERVPCGHIPGSMLPDPIAPTPRNMSAMICRELDFENDLFAFGEVDKVGEADGENDGVGERMSAETERLERHGRRMCEGE